MVAPLCRGGGPEVVSAASLTGSAEMPEFCQSAPACRVNLGCMATLSLSVLKQSVSFSLGCRLIRGNLSTGWLPRIQLTAAPLQFETQGGPFHRAMEGPARCNAPR